MRLTERKTIYPKCDNQENLVKVDYIEIKNKKLAEEKLCQLEDIEDEFGCDFIFLNEICKNGVYCYKRSIKDFNANGKRLGKIIHIPNFDIHIQFFGCYKKKKMGVSIMGCIDYVYHSLSLNEYGKTWALTREELK